MNALFRFNGHWHLMQQWHARPQTSIGHAVSTDLLNFSRVADVLAAGETGGQCFDGSASIVERSDVGGVGGAARRLPMLMIDGGCGMKGPGSLPCMESLGNGSTGGVTAWPTDPADPLLVNWLRAR